jgi:hypothetical protein
MGNHSAIGIVSCSTNGRGEFFITGFRLTNLNRILRIVTDTENTHESPACHGGKCDERLKLMSFINGPDNAEESENVLPPHR